MAEERAAGTEMMSPPTDPTGVGIGVGADPSNPVTSGTQPVAAQPGKQNPPNPPTETTQPSQAIEPHMEYTVFGNKKPMASRAVDASGNPTAEQPADQFAQHPLVQKAGLLKSVAETMAGGQRFQTIVDSTGMIRRVPMPMSGRQIGMAIALEAISGALSGLQAGRGRGPGAAGMAGFDRGKQIVQQRDEREDADYARQASIAHTNFTMAMNQQALAGADRATQQQSVDTWKPVYDQLVQQGGIDPNYQLVNYTKLHELMADGSKHITKDMAIPVRVIDRIGPDGKQALGQFGEKQSETLYAIANPTAQINMPAATLKWLQDHKIQGFVDGEGKPIPLPSDLPARLHMIAYGIETAQTQQNVQAMVNGWNRGQQNPLHEDTKPGAVKTAGGSLWSAYPESKQLAQVITQHEGAAEGNINHRNNNPGNLVYVGQKGATKGEGGFAKFATWQDGMDALVSQLDKWRSEYPNLTPEQLINGNGEFKGYSAAGAPGNSAESAKSYIDAVTKNGQGSGGDGSAVSKGASEEPVFVHPKVDVDTAMHTGLLTKDDLSTMLKIGNPKNFFATKPGEESEANKMKMPPESVGRIRSYLAGDEGVDAVETKYQAYLAQQAEDRAADRVNRLADDKAARERATAAANQRFIHEGPEGYRAKPEYNKLSPAELEQQLHADGVKNLPGIFDMLYKAGHYDLKDDDFAQRVWAKGSPDEMDRQTALQYIIKYINPYFSENRYNEVQGMVKAAGKPDSQFSQQITSFQQFLQHVGEAIDANDSLRGRPDLGDKLVEPVSWWKKNASGDPAFKDFIAAIEPVKQEYLAFLGNNRAAHDINLEAMQGVLNGTESMANAEIVLKRMAQTAALRAKDTDDKWRRVTGSAFPNFINDQALYGISKLTDQSGSNRTADVLADLDNGGDLLDSPSGFGNQGKKVADALAEHQPTYKRVSATPWAGKTYPGQRPGETAVIRDGKLVGFTMPGKGMRPPTQPQTQPPTQ